MMKITCTKETCTENIQAVRDALYVLNGKWKLLVIIALSEGATRFTEIEKSIGEITPKVLSKELRELELNEFIERKVLNTVPVQIHYELTSHSDSLKEVIASLAIWGKQHREYILAKRKRAQSKKDTEEVDV
ncbi:helix-turn-helix domain-containing protein [Olivibacter sp. CPCC 100613]|uniref:winged helix-turn-helix transcriptional regulator n=1 Tax=Olivibacter sp. CPCC 100613 TaxID=3079931 RepID=UPI002FF4D93B